LKLPTCVGLVVQWVLSQVDDSEESKELLCQLVLPVNIRSKQKNSEQRYLPLLFLNYEFIRTHSTVGYVLFPLRKNICVI